MTISHETFAYRQIQRLSSPTSQQQKTFSTKFWLASASKYYIRPNGTRWTEMSPCFAFTDTLKVNLPENGSMKSFAFRGCFSFLLDNKTKIDFRITIGLKNAGFAFFWRSSIPMRWDIKISPVFVRLWFYKRQTTCNARTLKNLKVFLYFHVILVSTPSLLR